jgi:D-inositol-3-phosphate glycosyltransferase
MHNNFISKKQNKKSLNIAMISMHASPVAELGGYKSGGMNLYVKEIALRLSKLGVRVDIYTRNDIDSSSEILELGPNVRLIYINAGPKKQLDPTELTDHIEQFVNEVENFRKFEKIQYDIVHSHYYLSGLIGIHISKLWSIPHVTMFHTLELAKKMAFKDTNESNIRIKLEKKVIKNVDKIICASSHEKNLIDNYFKSASKKVNIIPLAVDTNVFHPNDMNLSREKLGIEQDPRIILCVSRIDPVKGIDILVKSFAKLQDDQLKLMIIGGYDAPNPYQVKLLKLVKRLNLEENIYFVGAIPHGDLVKYYNASNLIVIPSLYESFGLVSLESFATQKPVIASNVGGLASTINNEINGLLFEPGNVEDLTKKINLLMKNHFLSEKIAKQAFLDVNKYSWDTAASQVFKVYESLLAVSNKIQRASSY